MKTPGANVSSQTRARDGACWLEYFESPYRGARVGKSARPDGLRGVSCRWPLAVSSSAAASWGTAGLISDASTLPRQPGEQLGGGDVYTYQLRAVLQVSVYNHGVRGIRPGGLGSLQVDFRADTRACSATILDPPLQSVCGVNYSPLYLTAL